MGAQESEIPFPEQFCAKYRPSVSRHLGRRDARTWNTMGDERRNVAGRAYRSNGSGMARLVAAADDLSVGDAAGTSAANLSSDQSPNDDQGRARTDCGAPLPASVSRTSRSQSPRLSLSAAHRARTSWN